MNSIDTLPNQKLLSNEKLLSLPTHGKLLIEASAGTGKTYTITSLVIRLLLNHLLPNPETDETLHSEHSALTTYTIDQLLIVTFTKSATEELRERIQKRIHIVRLFLDPSNVQSAQETDDHFLHELKIALADNLNTAYRALLQAERMIHHANIFTIHGFCTRLLKQFSLETKHMLDITLNENVDSITEQFAQQLWRKNIYSYTGLTQTLWKNVLGSTPDNISQAINKWKSRSSFIFEPAQNNLATLIKQVEVLETEFTHGWSKDTAQLIEARLLELKKGRSYTKRNIPNWVSKITEFVHTHQGKKSLSTLDSLDKLSYQRIQEHLETPLELAPSITRLLDIIDELLTLYPAINHARHPYLHQQYQDFLQTIKEEKRELTFASLLKHAAESINPEDQQLIKEITTSLPIAIIDEFQDTDPQQFHIFDSLFGSSVTQNPTSTLYMIGDPKQAIYAFRGGDIYTYLKAKSRANEQFTLRHNWRSTPEMVEAINHVFSQTELPFLHNDIPYPKVLAGNNTSEQLIINGKAQPAITWLTHNKSYDKASDYAVELAHATANHITEYLAHGQLTKPKHKNSPIKENQIAILVQNKNEAQLIKYALNQHNLPYTYYSEKQHVYQTEQAQQLLFLLQAINSPKNSTYVKTLMACGLVNLPLAEIQAVDNDANLLNSWQVLLSSCAQQLQNHSIFSALHYFYQQQNTLAQLQSQTDGKQKVANLLQLTELLHEALTKEKNIARIQQFLQQQRHTNTENEDLRQRIGSTDSRINIYTLHKCKGLEFDIVYIPFISSPSGFREDKNTLYFYHNIDNQLILDLKADDDAKTKTRNEDLAESIRLCYVGITRSKYACYIGLMPSEQLQYTALSHLLNIDATNYDETVAQLCEHPHIDALSIEKIIEDTDEATGEITSQTERMNRTDHNSLLKTEVLHFSRKLDTHWRISSYTQLSQKSHDSHTAYYHNMDALDDAVTTENSVPDEVPAFTDSLSIFNFPRGAQAGLFWHEWLENIDVEHKELTAHAKNQLPSLCQRYGIDTRWEETLMLWLDNVLNTPLTKQDSLTESVANGLTLKTIKNAARINEMEFLFSVSDLRDKDINKVLQQSSLSAKIPADSHQQLNFVQFKGFLKGFIDLIFEHDGQFYIADYKSNYLGNSQADYGYDALEQNVLSHRYDVQLLLYVFALHRYLKSKLPNYDYDMHIGGAYYFYLRGMNGESLYIEPLDNESETTNGVFFHKPEREVIEQFEQLITESEQIQ